MVSLLLISSCLLVLISIAVNALILLVICRLLRVRSPARATATEGPPTRVTYKRSLTAVLVIAALNGVLSLVWIFLGQARHLDEASRGALFPALLLIGLVSSIRLVFRTSLGKSVLVAVLFLMLNTAFALSFAFGIRRTLAEALIVPTGSMAETLLGANRLVTCPQCGWEFPISGGFEIDQPPDLTARTVSCICPNCRYFIDFRNERLDPPWMTGDRIVVGKGILGSRLWSPMRMELVVCHYPPAAEQNEPLLYVRRVAGLPGETIAIHQGKLYVSRELDYTEVDKDVPASERWHKEHMHPDDGRALELFKQGKFQIVRKSPREILTQRRLVNDNNHQATDLQGKQEPRWSPDPNSAAWVADDPNMPRRFQYSGRADDTLAWLRYHHRLRSRFPEKPELITDFLGYNTWNADKGFHHVFPPENWVGDLLIECDVDIAESRGELVLELSKGDDRFRTSWDLASGVCSLIRVSGKKEENLAEKETVLRRPGKYRLRLANVDERLTVWINDTLPFGEGIAYSPPQRHRPTRENDLEPASVGVRGGALSTSALRLWRDTYHMADPISPDAGSAIDFSDPATWQPLANLTARTFYVQPGHFLVLGDNSPESSDSRTWGLVPERLLVGKVFLLYYPFSRFQLLP